LYALVRAATPHGEPPSSIVGYDVTRDSAVPGLYHAAVAYAPGNTINLDLIKWHALLNGVEAARKEGYDLAVWSGPKSWTNTRTTVVRGLNVSADRKTTIPGFVYVVQSYKSDGAHPSSAFPVATLIDQITGEIARAKR
jgi:hypothetical protein